MDTTIAITKQVAPSSSEFLLLLPQRPLTQTLNTREESSANPQVAASLFQRIKKKHILAYQ